VEKLDRHTRCSRLVALVSLETTTIEEEALLRGRLAAGTAEDEADLRGGMEIFGSFGGEGVLCRRLKNSTVRDRPGGLQF
jgi:hypothetical protein